MNKKKTDIVRVASIVLAVLNGFALLLSSGYSLHIRHSFMQIFDEMGVEIPVITQFVFGIHWTTWILITLVVLVTLVLKELISNKWIPLILNGIFILAGIVYWKVFSSAMLIPVMNMT